jgi:hypothetical protein
MPKAYFSGKGSADLPLHYGQVPPWLAQRMSALGGAIMETILLDYGKSEVLKRLSDPFWFQALGAVMGMDWHSSGITTSVMGALKKAINPKSKELGIYICGGKGRFSKETPNELLAIANKTGLDGLSLVHASKLSAKVDNTAIQDGFQLYLHSFILSDTGEWAVVQQGMNENVGMARRYHWHSTAFQSFLETPHTFIYGENQGQIINLTDSQASDAKAAMLDIVHENPDKIMPEIRRLFMPSHHDVRAKDVNLKRLGATLALARDMDLKDFESLLMLQVVGPRTIQSLALVSEVIHGTPSRFEDPARFSFAHGGKDGHPFPIPIKVYDETISILRDSVEKAKVGETDKKAAIHNLFRVSEMLESDFKPNADFDKVIAKERAESYKYGGRTVFGMAKPPKYLRDKQLDLF